MGNALISRASVFQSANIVQETGNSTTSVMSQNASTVNFAGTNHTHSANDILSDVLSMARGGTGTSNFYEKGTWTPSIASTGSIAPSVSYGYRYGVYYRIGNLVYIGCHIKMSISSVGSNYACITGLPYKCVWGTDKYALSLVEEYYAVENGDGDPRGMVMQDTTQIHIRGKTGSMAVNWKTGTDQYIGYCGCYIKT